MAPNPFLSKQNISSNKKIYFIRHGEHERIDSKPGGSSLNERGIQQAHHMAKRCEKLPIQALISSTLTRAQETANIIGTHIGKEVELSDLFVERHRPSVQKGKPLTDPDMVAVDEVITAHFHIPGYRHSDEENFDDLKLRAQRALDYLAHRKEEHIAVVTHGFFMRILMGVVIFGDQLTAPQAQRFMKTFHLENTGLTVIGFDGSEKEFPWWLWVWNDHAHLG